MTKIKSLLIAASLMMGLALPATAQIGEPRQNFSVGFNGGVNLNSASFTPKIKQNSLMGITGGLTARYISEKYFAMICGAQVELNISQRGWDELFEVPGENGEPVEDPTRKYTRKMTYLDIPFLAHLAFGNEKGLQFFINAGPQIGLLIGESESMENIDMNALTDTQKAVYGDKIQNKFDYGIAGGGGIEFRTKKAGSFPARRTLLFCSVRLLQHNEERLFLPCGSWHNYSEAYLSIRFKEIRSSTQKDQARISLEPTVYISVSLRNSRLFYSIRNSQCESFPHSYRSLSAAFTITSSRPIARIASTFRTIDTNGKQSAQPIRNRLASLFNAK